MLLGENASSRADTVCGKLLEVQPIAEGEAMAAFPDKGDEKSR